MTHVEFTRLLQLVADGWNTKHARKAAQCFTDDAVYFEPPDKQFIQGQDELFLYFGGNDGFDMKLTWHNIFYDENAGRGAGEYEFEMDGIIHHGVALIEIAGNRISSWWEYDTPSQLSRSEFLKIEGKSFRFSAKNLKK